MPRARRAGRSRSEARTYVRASPSLCGESRDGTEKLDVPDASTVSDLQLQIERDLGPAVSDQKLSLDQGLVRHLFVPPGASSGCPLLAAAFRTRQRPPPFSRPAPFLCQLLSKSPESFTDMKDTRRTLQSLGVRHGSLVREGTKPEAATHTVGPA